MKVKELMNRDPVTIYSANNIQTASEIMAKESKGFLAVLDSIENKSVVGVLSNTDIIEKVIANKQTPESVLVKDIMVTNIISLCPEDQASKAMLLMRKNKVKRLLVLNNGVLQGVISSNDLLDLMLKQKKALLDMAIEF